jgi:hypothetical protein
VAAALAVRLPRMACRNCFGGTDFSSAILTSRYRSTINGDAVCNMQVLLLFGITIFVPVVGTLIAHKRQHAAIAVTVALFRNVSNGDCR